MQIDVVYPKPQRERQIRARLLRALRGPFLFAAYICPILNIVTGGKAWSVIVVWSLWLVWTTLISPALVEVNRISTFIKLIADSCVLLILIDLLLSPGWAKDVVPIVCYSGLLVCGALLFTDLERQRQNMLPLLLLIAASLVVSVVGLIVWRGESRWALAVMGALAFALLVACAAALGTGFIRELKKRFHTR